MYKICTALVLFLLISSGCGPTTVSQLETEHNARQLEPASVLKLVESNTLLFSSIEEDSYFYFDRSGRLFGTDIYENTDNGRWDVTSEGELCMRLSKWWLGDLRCFTVYSNKDKYSLVNSSGVIAFTGDYFAGDHKNQYFEEKTQKKSYRTSIRNKQATTSSTAPRVQDEDIAAETEKPPVQKTVYTPPSPGELKSTVKWMARDCPGCNLEKSNLKKADLVGAKLYGANLSGADLSMANLRRAELQDANLEYADLSFANMPGANLRNSNLKGANLQGANLIRADLTGADLEGANLDGALLEGVQGMN